jgi:hypothetical protein
MPEMTKVKYGLLDNSLGDAAKFLHCWDEPSICAVLDDDLILPSDYISYMYKRLSYYWNAVSLHGKSYAVRPIKSFRRDFTANYRCLNTVGIDSPVDVIGTGVLMFDNRQILRSNSLFEHKNMADILFSRHCVQSGHTMMVLKHHLGWVHYMPQPTTIWRESADDSVQTRILNEFLK